MAQNKLNKTEKTLNNLNQVTVQIEEDFHELLEAEERTEAELKDELHEDEKLLKLTNRGLQVVDQLEKVEENLNQHVRAAEKGQDHNDMADILGHSLEDIEEDINMLGNVLNDISLALASFKRDSDKTAKEISTFKDIEDHIEKGGDKITELAKSLKELEEGEYTNTTVS